MKVYCCSGWFSPAQEDARQSILAAIREVGFEVYSPKDDFLYEVGVTRPQEVFDENIKHIVSSNLVIASTVEKDMGALFECGYANAVRTPIIYFWPGNGKGKFNLMLSQTAIAVVHSKKELIKVLKNIKKLGVILTMPYTGDIE